jgi:hypothetical protein
MMQPLSILLLGLWVLRMLTSAYSGAGLFVDDIRIVLTHRPPLP